MLPGKLDGLFTVTGLAYNGVPLFFEHLLEVETDQRLVLSDDDTGRQRRHVRLVVVGRVYGLGRLGGGHGGSSLRAGQVLLLMQPT
jgi:hypothetical protein